MKILITGGLGHIGTYIIENIKKIKERFFGDWSKEIPIFDILLTKDNKITLKL